MIDKRRAYKFCSFQCYQEWRIKNPPEANCKCLMCKKDFHLKPSAIKNGQGKFCSRSCKIENQRLGIEIRNESYNDRHLIRQSSEYKTWREKAKRLKGNKCEKCGIEDRNVCKCCGTQIFLHVHHIKPFATHQKLRFDPQNASVLCPKCHLGHR